MTTLLMLPPQTATTREWAARVSATLPELTVVVAEDEAHAAREIGRVEAAFGGLALAAPPGRAAPVAGRPRRPRRPRATTTTS